MNTTKHKDTLVATTYDQASKHTDRYTAFHRYLSHPYHTPGTQDTQTDTTHSTSCSIMQHHAASCSRRKIKILLPTTLPTTCRQRQQQQTNTTHHDRYHSSSSSSSCSSSSSSSSSSRTLTAYTQREIPHHTHRPQEGDTTHNTDYTTLTAYTETETASRHTSTSARTTPLSPTSSSGGAPWYHSHNTTQSLICSLPYLQQYILCTRSTNNI